MWYAYMRSFLQEIMQRAQSTHTIPAVKGSAPLSHPRLIALVSLFGRLLLSELGRLDQSSYGPKGGKLHQRANRWSNNNKAVGSSRGWGRSYWITISLIRPAEEMLWGLRHRSRIPFSCRGRKIYPTDDRCNRSNATRLWAPNLGKGNDSIVTASYSSVSKHLIRVTRIWRVQTLTKDRNRKDDIS
jgi:hypothetical protein